MMADIFARQDRILGGFRDGYEHKRDETGFCGNCGATPRELHYALVPKNDAPIYRKLVRS